ncbi:hypothetical protein ABWH91_11450 [Phycisphaerales bacterium ac7]
MERRGPVLEFDDVVEVDPGDDALIVASVAGESGDAGVVRLLELDLVASATLGEVTPEFSGRSRATRTNSTPTPGASMASMTARRP